ncbi:MAG: EamA family transporter [Treponema sp.]|nr:EamA family transporter [Treponema sp.]
MTINYLIIVVMTLTASFAGFFLKKSAGSVSVKNIILNKYLYIGGILYTITAIINIWILQKLPYSVVVPLGSITYIWTLIISYLFLKEKINTKKIIGILFIITGVVCININ